MSVRMNPRLGTGSTKRTNTGGPAVELRDLARDILGARSRRGGGQYRLRDHAAPLPRGSGTDPEIWKRRTRMTRSGWQKHEGLQTQVRAVNLGGGFEARSRVCQGLTQVTTQPSATWGVSAIRAGTRWRSSPGTAVASP